ncbi:EAL domain-containing protein [Arcobacter sp. YIC-310]|uniref:EAL domain-containing protein n=2 Tax=unclassified Arcobacter TaxID=2593671 RepID=UPI00384DB005
MDKEIVMKKLNYRVFGIFILLIGVFLFAINLKNDLDRFNKNYNHLIETSYKIKYNTISHLQEIKNSIIFLHYNNDNIVLKIKENKKLIRELKYLFNYSHTFDLINKFKLQYKEFEDLTYDFMRKNAEVKNSLSNLNRNLNISNNFDFEYSLRLIDIISKFMLINGSFDINKNISDEQYLFFKSYKANESKYALMFTHIDLLYKSIPKLKIILKKLQNAKIYETNEKIFTMLEKESNILRREIKLKFYIILFAYIFSMILILYYISKSIKDNKNILKLKTENEKKLFYDSLTGLLNRTSYSLVSRKKNRTLILIDIIDFNKVNSLVGYEGGDFLLKDIAKILDSKFDKVYRVGVDHFAILFEDKSLDDLVRLSKNLLLELDNNKFVYRSIEVPVSVNIGISNIRSYLKNAEIAISNSKKSFNRVSIYKKEMSEKEETLKNFNMLTQVKQAIDEDKIRPFFQGIIDLKTKKIVKYEALVRLIDEKENIISPFFFLDITKKSKLYPEITKIVIKKSIEFIENKNKCVSINLSYQDINDNNTLEFIYKTLYEKKDIASFITFEILESDEIDNYAHLYTFIEKIKSYGCKLAIDDFGSGYSNFTQLFNLKPDIVKIDGSLIKDINTNNNSKNIVESIINLSKKSNIQTVAEFVDNKEVEETIIKLGANLAQGFYYTKPEDLL